MKTSRLWGRRVPLAAAIALVLGLFGPHPNIAHVGYLPMGLVFLAMVGLLFVMPHVVVDDSEGVFLMLAIYGVYVGAVFVAALVLLSRRSGRRREAP